jgi:sporulation protein YlmC with PRC-barrel domain
MRLKLGAAVRCADGPFGELSDVVIDPVRRRVTHLVVQPEHRHGLARLVPADLLTAAGEQDVTLACSCQDVLEREPMQEFAFLRAGDVPSRGTDWQVGVEDVVAMPAYDAGGFDSSLGDPERRFGVTYDRIPKGEVEIRPASSVTSSDGHEVGRVDGFALDVERRITAVLVRTGRLWRRRTVSVRVDTVAELGTDVVALNLRAREVSRLRGASSE